MATTNLFQEFEEDMNVIYNKFKHTDQFMLLLNDWIVKYEYELYAQYGV